MERKLIALDLDGTTLNAKTQISAKTKSVLTKAKEAGHIVSIVTGRPNRMATSFYHELKLTGPMINFNGALGYIPGKNWEHEYQATFPKKITFDILANKEKWGIKVIAAEGKNLLLSDVADNTVDGFFLANLTQEHVLNKQNLTTDPTAMTMLVDNQNKASIVQKLNEHFGHKITVGVWGGPNPVLELAPKNINKAYGVDFLAKTYHIDRRNIIAFGDEHNDEEMLKFAGLGVAMQNGTEHIKQIADDVTALDNDHDGLANYLEKKLHL
ncbi:hypothetical protein SAMN05216431_103129 [Ligilactobacillus sp. WC1T17]|uniref:Cof-type HAD-IIB family hydrolase n=1 Tax=Ligilactobacillus ruminis TaxID=1623 RepID=A0ABY1AAC0_9LACO|nr:hypothetical protein SAMN05216431_103129 [Ligilactobacillus ruminis]